MRHVKPKVFAPVLNVQTAKKQVDIVHVHFQTVSLGITFLVFHVVVDMESGRGGYVKNAKRKLEESSWLFSRILSQLVSEWGCEVCVNVISSVTDVVGRSSPQSDIRRAFWSFLNIQSAVLMKLSGSSIVQSNVSSLAVVYYDQHVGTGLRGLLQESLLPETL